MTILSGARPTGEPHIGHYFGKLKQEVALQKSHKGYFFIADLHAITEPFEPKEIAHNTLQLLAAYLAVGLDPKKSVIFLQSAIPEHSELAWIFESLLPVGELNRMTQYKDMQKKYGGSISAGIFNYPALMAADILIYKAEGVTIGDDQRQHLELARTIARKFNSRFGKTFPEPRAILPKVGARIKSLIDPTKKMSKSDEPGSYIGLFDKPEVIAKKIKAAVTDSGHEIKYHPATKPAISNLIEIYHLFSEQPIARIEKEFSDKGYGEFKKQLAELVIGKLAPFQAKYHALMKSRAKLEKILANGTEKARKIAQATMKEVRKKVLGR
jgi:tryptophanyl-tRNA synthetase